MFRCLRFTTIVTFSRAKPAMQWSWCSLLQHKNLVHKQRNERLFLVLSQLEALLKIAEHGDITQHAEATLYHYFDIMQDRLAEVKTLCEWLDRQAAPQAPASTADTA